MPFNYTERIISLSDIDAEKETLRITTNTETGDLVFAFRRVGLTRPPIVKVDAEGYGVVCGFRRVATARSLGWETIAARILPQEADMLFCASLAILENVIERPLNLIETSRALSLLASFFSNEEELYQYAENIGLPHHPSFIKKVLPLCRLPQALQQGIITGELALPSVQILSKWPEKTAISLAEFLTPLKLSLHKQRELIDIIEEISIRDDCSIESVLTSPEILRILDDPEFELPRKAGLIRDVLKKRRFPHLTRAQNSFDRLKGELKLGMHVSLNPPPGFEGGRYGVSLSFSSLGELESQIQSLRKLTENKRFAHHLSSREPLRKNKR